MRDVRLDKKVIPICIGIDGRQVVNKFILSFVLTQQKQKVKTLKTFAKNELRYTKANELPRLNRGQTAFAFDVALHSFS